MQESLLQKYLNGNCSVEEVKALLHYFRENPSEVEHYFKEEEWEEFYKTNSDFVPQHQSEKIFHNVEHLIAKDRKKRRNAYLISGSIAAALLFFIAFNFWDRQSATLNNRPLLVTKHTTITHRNNSATNLQVSLSDGSVVDLYPKSQIRYDTLTDKTIDVYLIGKAEFRVQHNSSRTFKVWCKDLVTTDIGTVFTIDGYQENIRIDLYEGEVAVAKTSEQEHQVFLKPGQFAHYNHQTHELAVNDIHNEEVLARVKNNKAPDLKKSDVLQFKNNSLKSVLDELAAKYHVNIEYPTKKISGIRMNMSVDTTQQIETILRNIALLNNLQLNAEGHGKFVLK